MRRGSTAVTPSRTRTRASASSSPPTRSRYFTACHASSCVCLCVCACEYSCVVASVARARRTRLFSARDRGAAKDETGPHIAPHRLDPLPSAPADLYSEDGTNQPSARPPPSRRRAAAPRARYDLSSQFADGPQGGKLLEQQSGALFAAGEWDEGCESKARPERPPARPP